MFIPHNALNLEAIISQSFAKIVLAGKLKFLIFPQFNHQAYLDQETAILKLFKQIATQELANISNPSLTAKRIDALVTIMKKFFKIGLKKMTTNYRTDS